MQPSGSEVTAPNPQAAAPPASCCLRLRAQSPACSSASLSPPEHCRRTLHIRVTGACPGCRSRGTRARRRTLQPSGFRVQGSGSRVQGPGFRVQGSGSRVLSRIHATVRVRDVSPDPQAAAPPSLRGELRLGHRIPPIAAPVCHHQNTVAALCPRQGPGFRVQG